MRDDARRERWEARAAIPLVVAALVFLGAYAWPILDPDLDRDLKYACYLTALLVWVLFGVDYTVRLLLAEHRRAFLRSNWIDLLILSLPILRPLRGLQILLALNMLARRGGGFARGRVVASVTAAVAMVSFVAALAMLAAERDHPDANIQSFGEAAWWASVTATTVGYGDKYPTTVEGRFIAVGLMLTGIALLGVVTASIASWFVEKMSQWSEADERTEDAIAELTAQVRELRREQHAQVEALRQELSATRPRET